MSEDKGTWLCRNLTNEEITSNCSLVISFFEFYGLVLFSFIVSFFTESKKPQSKKKASNLVKRNDCLGFSKLHIKII
jgi:hypothetical protein